ncbi:MAG: nicotinate phosphoribosyltransferase [Candidatus Nealsonbacteria bacterium RIFOXYB1_FULL_40_15]|uniref:Nicotinate phosphoribosyltransferase n=2 Tax=Candidatus Nealsoniibacteriota TaxID=1817911 RepID=A0A1G2ETV5_9BACT|nr:MAG: nicotinate phosphoribosyltransferase [Candidatus Nealsonbacteria bacterium RIFOXYB1_FULL_40_15]OGZ29224.1 MAG: nicotinate phosphoribosyltransferase [Candidatus Nealsonbacteria bacterium RIFOXYC1_FULL_40_7]OGZ29595.1 MAG: nicotinate phosphoribosyltransferase [Candidatus Nealsonbacteria bacterium RIFOXYD1_FULL_39_11]
MIHDFIKKEDLNLMVSASRLTLGAVWIEEEMGNVLGSVDVFVRDLPDNRNYLVFVGLENVIDYLLNLKFRKEHLDFFQKQYNFSAKVKNFYKKFRFTGDLYAMPEGSIFFPKEPVIRITAPLVEIQLIEQFIINTVMSMSMFASKLSRFESACTGITNGLALQRTHGFDAIMKNVRAGIISGIDKFPMALASMKYNFPAEGGMSTHIFVTSFSSEIEAFEKYAKYFPERAILLIDTYNIDHGIKSFIKVAKEVEKRNKKLRAIALDSGDVIRDSIKARKALDAAGLKYVQIAIMGNIDEFKAQKLIKNRASVDLIVGGTELTTCTDKPQLELVFKLSEIIRDKKSYPKMKLSSGKISLPGRKQVYRYSSNEKYLHDIIGLENEDIKGAPLLKPYIKNGKLIRKMPDIKKITKYHLTEKDKFSKELMDINKKANYRVSLSSKLKVLTQKTKQEIQKMISS